MAEVPQSSRAFARLWQQIGMGEMRASNPGMVGHLRALAGAALYGGVPEISSRPDIVYDVEPLRQRPAECMQTAAAMLLRYYQTATTVEAVLAEVPVYEKGGIKRGTAPGHIGAYLQRKDVEVLAVVGDTELFPSTTNELLPVEVLAQLEARIAAV